MLQKMGRSVHCPFLLSENASGRFPFLKIQKESVIGIADFWENAYNISVAFFGFHKKTIECTLCEHSIVMNYKESGFNLENYI